MPVRIQEQDFDVSSELAALRAGDKRVGAVASFVGVVRDLNDASQVSTLTLEHYPGMTEKALAQIVDDAKRRWDICEALPGVATRRPYALTGETPVLRRVTLFSFLIRVHPR